MRRTKIGFRTEPLPQCGGSRNMMASNGGDTGDSHWLRKIEFVGLSSRTALGCGTNDRLPDGVLLAATRFVRAPGTAGDRVNGATGGPRTGPPTPPSRSDHGC